MEFKRLRLILLLVMLTTFLSACGQKSVKVDNDEVRKYSEPILESILLSANKDDYTTYSRDFSDKMKQALTEANFKQQNKLIKDKIGDYQSKSFVKAQASGEYMTAIYSAKYSKEPKVVMVTITFKNGDEEHKVEGLFMTSPTLASK